jgi:hypothetical protein
MAACSTWVTTVGTAGPEKTCRTRLLRRPQQRADARILHAIEIDRSHRCAPAAMRANPDFREHAAPCSTGLISRYSAGASSTVLTPGTART